MTFKIPSFMSKMFSSAKTKQEKDTLVQSYKNWYHNEITQELIKDLERALEELQEEEDKKFDFVSLFQSKHVSANYKGQRAVLKKIIKKLNYQL